MGGQLANVRDPGLLDWHDLQSDNLSSNVLSSGLFMVHDTGGGCENDVPELTGRKELDDPLLEIG